MKAETRFPADAAPSNLDLIVLVADADAEWALRTLLEQRSESLGIRPLRYEVRRHPGHDPGVFREAPAFLRAYVQRADYALVLLDRAGSGVEHRLAAQEMEGELEERLKRNGWSGLPPRAAAIVLDPELEVWVWTRSPHVAEVLGVSQEQLEHILGRLPATEGGKPAAPKEALKKVLRQSRRPFSARIFRELAERVSL